MNFIYVIHLMCWNYLIDLITHNINRKQKTEKQKTENRKQKTEAETEPATTLGYTRC